MNIYQHDLEPPLWIDLTYQADPDDEATIVPVNLSSATAIRVIGKRGDSILIDRQLPLDDTLRLTEGHVVMPWELGDTAQTGAIKFEVEVMWPGDRPQTFRPKKVVTVFADYA